MSRIVKAHMSDPSERNESLEITDPDKRPKALPRLSAASMSVRNSLPHMLPGVLLRYARNHKLQVNVQSFVTILTTNVSGFVVVLATLFTDVRPPRTHSFQI